MKLPSDRVIHRSEIAEFWFNDERILYCNASPAERTIENLTSSFELVQKITGGKKVCLLVDLSNTGVQNKKERDFATAMLPRYYRAIAVISNSDFGRALTNIFLSIYNLPMPMKLFKDEEDARKWLKSFL